MVNVNHFEKETECIYKEEKYSVRDNGGVLRHSIEGKRHKKIGKLQLNFFVVRKKAPIILLLLTPQTLRLEKLSPLTNMQNPSL